MRAITRRSMLLCAAALAAGAARAEPLALARLQRLLAASARPAVRFEEVRESPWLAAPVTSRGTLHSTPQSLEKRVVFPREEVWRLLPDRIEWAGPGGGGPKQVSLGQAPALAALANVLRSATAGDLVALERDFRIELRGDEQAWVARLVPRNTAVSQHVDSIDLQGTGGRLQSIIVVEAQGARTTTRLLE